MNYYNDNDPFAAEWLRKLIAQKLIPEGYVDDRSINEIDPQTLRGYTQCHFFAGIGGWPLALQIAGVSSTTPLWTGSCPCQPLSSAGKQLGEKDERHLWPEFYRLISECLPVTVFGEQVASNVGLEWLDGVSLDLEELGYAVGSSDLPAAGVGAPNIRQRAWWVAQSDKSGTGHIRGKTTHKTGGAMDAWPTGLRQGHGSVVPSRVDSRGADGGHGGMGNAEGVGRTGRPDNKNEGRRKYPPGYPMPWDRSSTIECSDGKTRRIPLKPSLFPLADGLPGRVGLLKGAGNSINPYVGAKFIKAFYGRI